MRHHSPGSLLAALLVGAGVCIAAPMEAALKAKTPVEACGFLSELGLSTGGWKNHYEDVFGCSSPYRELGAGNPMPNNLAYYVDGKRSSVSLVKLVLNVNNRATAKSAHAELLEAAQALSLKASGEKLPPELQAAVRDGNEASARVGRAVVDVVRIDWPTGKGYEIKVIFQ